HLPDRENVLQRQSKNCPHCRQAIEFEIVQEGNERIVRTLPIAPAEPPAQAPLEDLLDPSANSELLPLAPAAPPVQLAAVSPPAAPPKRGWKFWVAIASVLLVTTLSAAL